MREKPASTYARIFEERGEADSSPEPEPKAAAAVTAAAEPTGPGQGRTVGRPKGKRSDPNYKQFSVLLRKEAVMQATHLLDYQDRGQDFSGLLQKLLDQWLKAQQNKAK